MMPVCRKRAAGRAEMDREYNMGQAPRLVCKVSRPMNW